MISVAEDIFEGAGRAGRIGHEEGLGTGAWTGVGPRCPEQGINACGAGQRAHDRLTNLPADASEVARPVTGRARPRPQESNGRFRRGRVAR